MCRGIFPKRNDYNDAVADFDELIPELARFGVITRLQLKRLLTRHRRELMRMDSAPFDEVERAIYSEWHGADVVSEHARRQYFFAYPAFVRNAMELEFGEEACVEDRILANDPAEVRNRP
jgi:hypothetical protein